MTTPKLQAGSRFPEILATDLNEVSRHLAQPQVGYDWMMLVVYRGRHCPMCTRYLNTLEEFKTDLAAIGVDVAAVSADNAAQLAAHQEQLEVSFPLYFGLSIEHMQNLGLYISDPRSPQETDHPFAEPGLFVINEVGDLQVVDISNNPFVRPNIGTLTSGLKWIRDPNNSYPIRGMRSYGD